MSQENVEIVRHLLARWECGDYHHAGVFDPQVLFTRTGGGSDVLGYTTESRGLVGLRAALQAWTEEWTDVRVEAQQLLAVGERVLAMSMAWKKLLRPTSSGWHRWGLSRARSSGNARGVETYFARLSDAWEEFRTVAEDLRDLGDHVVMLGRIEGRGKGSGVPIDTSLGQIFDFRDGKVCRIRSYLDHSEALNAVGLAE
jgi:ketosteroid isomerase-like protein